MKRGYQPVEELIHTPPARSARWFARSGPRHGPSLALIALVGVTIAGCGGGQARDGAEGLPVQTWCDEIAMRHCGTQSDRCLGGMASYTETCRAALTDTCVGRREREESSERSQAELTACTQWIEAQTCDALAEAERNEEFQSLCALY